MGWHFRAMSGTDPFVIDQTVTVTFQGEPQPWVQELLAALGETLAAYGGTAGILRDHAPESLNTWSGVDAVIVSTDNTLAWRCRRSQTLNRPEPRRSVKSSAGGGRRPVTVARSAVIDVTHSSLDNRIEGLGVERFVERRAG